MTQKSCAVEMRNAILRNHRNVSHTQKSFAWNVCDFSQDDTLTFFHIISFQFIFSFDSIHLSVMHQSFVTILSVLFILYIYHIHCMLYALLPQEHRESKKRLEETVDELKKELSAAEHQLQKNTMEIKVLAYLYMQCKLCSHLVSEYCAMYLPPIETCVMEICSCLFPQLGSCVGKASRVECWQLVNSQPSVDRLICIDKKLAYSPPRCQWSVSWLSNKLPIVSIEYWSSVDPGSIRGIDQHLSADALNTHRYHLRHFYQWKHVWWN